MSWPDMPPATWECEHAKLYCGDVVDVLGTLPDCCVNCVVTSPPYWGLRDYGTAEWDGGDAECDHSERATRGDSGRPTCSPRPCLDGKPNEERQQFRQHCRKCGATRIDKQLGLESTPDEYVARMVAVFREVRRVLADDGTCWMNLGDSYSSGGRDSFGTFSPDSKQATHANIKQTPRPGQPPGLKPKDLVGIPWRVAFALQADGWWLRQDIIWSKPNPMPESVTDRCTKAHEYLFLLTKSARYYYDAAAIAEASTDPESLNGRRQRHSHALAQSDPDGMGRTRVGFLEGRANQEGVQYITRNRRSVWTITTEPYPEAHFATYPTKLVKPCIKAGCPKDGIVLDPFLGSGTTGQVALSLGNRFVGIELSAEYMKLAVRRIDAEARQGKLFQ